MEDQGNLQYRRKKSNRKVEEDSELFLSWLIYIKASLFTYEYVRRKK